MRVQSKLIGLAGVFAVMAAMAACGSNGGTGNTGGNGTNGCVPGTTQECACLGGTTGVQTCKDDGKGFDTCQCPMTTTTGSGGATSSSSSSGTTATCGNGIIEASDHCDTPSSEQYCASDCMLMGTGGAGTGGAGGACAGHVYYAGKFDNAGSVWANLPAAGGMTSLDAGNAQCKALNVGADHVCDYEEIKAAAANSEPAFMALAQGTTAWLQRTTPAMVNGQMSAPGPGGRCNNWTYATNHISDGEYVTFDTAGVPTFHLDNDTVFDPNNPHVIANDLQCGGTMRSILCCYTACN